MRMLVIVILSSLASAPVAARELEVSWGARVHESGSSSLDAVSASDVTSFVDGGAAMRVGSLPILGRIWVGLQLGAGSWSARNFDSMDASLSTVLVQVTARGVRQLHPRLRAYVRGDAGFAFSSLTLESGGSVLTDDVIVPSFYGGAGLDATLFAASPAARNPDLALALRFEAGWMEIAGQTFTSSPGRPDDGREEITIDGAPLGSLDASGLSFRIGIVGRF